MQNEELIYAENRAAWRHWLENNFQTQVAVWLVFPNKSTNEVSVSYNDAVEEALCFGWIDGIVKKLDDTHRMWRFSPRRKGRSYSQSNIERLKSLRDRGLIHASLLPRLNEVIDAEFIFPEDIISILKSDKQVWENYQQFSDVYKRVRIAYIETARNYPPEFEKRLKYFINKTREGCLIKGAGGVPHLY